MNEYLLYAAPAAGVLALIYAYYKAGWVKKQDAGTKEMQDIAKEIQVGAMAFLAREYKVLAIFVVAVAALLALANMDGGETEGLRGERSSWIAVSFVIGAICSGLAGFFGMKVATDANVRTTAAARDSMEKALHVAFSGGAVMGMSVVGLALIGLGGLYIVYTMGVFVSTPDVLYTTMNVLTGFSMGASSIALFARVGGGIYTKAADVGADLVGKVESGLPEDDPRNPAVIADNVGDNVGDVAGMGADLFESYVGAIVGAMVLALGFTAVQGGELGPVMMPLVIAAAGVIASIIGTFFVKTKEGGNPQIALDIGTFGAAGVMAVATFGIAHYMWPEGGTNVSVGGITKLDENGVAVLTTAMDVGIATVIGLATGVLVGLITSYYCSMDKPPVDSIAEQSKTGTATNIIAGLGVGMQSTALPVIVIAAGVVGSAYVAGLYGVAIAALGMLSTTGIQLAVDAYGPIADNAGGIAEMSHQDAKVRERTDKLDAVGNTTAAIGKGFAIGSAAMTALALFAAFSQQARIDGINISKPLVMAGLFLGGMLPFLFSSMAMKAVGEAAMAMIEEVRRQFREIPGLLEGTAKPDTARCVDISTSAAIRKMVLPGALAIVTPVAAGFLMGPEALGGLLAGVTVSGVCMAIFMSNAGGAWDNAKKSFEGGGYKMKDGKVHEKGSDAHTAAVVGDTVGDPFKDTAGPSLNILVKLMSVVALVIAPLIALTPTSADVPTISAETEQVEEDTLADSALEMVEEAAETVTEITGEMWTSIVTALGGYDFKMARADVDGESGVRLFGTLPTETARTELVGWANERFDHVDADGIRISPEVGIPTEGLGVCLDKGLTALGSMSRGEIRFDDAKLEVLGEGEGDMAAVTALFSELPAGFTMDNPPQLLDSNAADACDTRLTELLQTPINFQSGSANIAGTSRPLLDELKTAIDACPTSVGIAIDGHTDASGDDASNQALSQQRADAVKTRLARMGIEEERMTSTGHGETNPVASNDTPDGQAQNRRIEMRLMRL